MDFVFYKVYLHVGKIFLSMVKVWKSFTYTLKMYGNTKLLKVPKQYGFGPEKGLNVYV